MRFAFDPEKSASNKEKHGIDFVEAQELWADPGVADLPVGTYGEVRSGLVAAWRNKLWAAIYTTRGDDVRIISVRRARKREEERHGRRQG